MKKFLPNKRNLTQTLLIGLMFLFFGVIDSYGQVFDLLPSASVLPATGVSTNNKVTVEYAWLDTNGNLLVAYSLVNPGGSKTPATANYNGITSTTFIGPFESNLKIGVSFDEAPPSGTEAWLVATFENVTLSDPFIIGLDIQNANGFDVEGLSVTLDDYTVTYNANGGEGVVNDYSNPYLENATVTILPNGFTRDTYNFTGWNTEADGSGTSYQSGNTFLMPAADVVLYAQWTLSCTETVTAGSDFSVCEIDDIDLTATFLAAYDSVKWTGPNSYTSTILDPVAFTASAAYAGKYYVYVYYNDGCVAEDSVEMIVNAPSFGEETGQFKKLWSKIKKRTLNFLFYKADGTIKRSLPGLN